jgi:hypothetical protein
MSQADPGLAGIQSVTRRLSAALAGCALLAACGKRGDPRPPLRRTPLPVTEFKLAQRGQELEISYVAPRTSTDGARLPLLEVQLLRVEVASAGAPDTRPASGPTEPAPETESAVTATTPSTTPAAAATKVSGAKKVTDTRDTKGKASSKTAKPQPLGEPRKVAPGEHVSYGAPLPEPGTELRIVAVATSKGRASTQSFARTLKVQLPPAAPHDLAVKSSQNGVALAWTAPDPMPAWIQPSPAPSPRPSPSPGASPQAPSPSAAPLPAPTPTPAPTPAPTPTPEPTPPPPPRAGGFNVYRRAQAPGSTLGVVNGAPVESPRYEDTTAEAGASYCYLVRTAVASEPLIESEASNEACLDVLDIKAPAAPVGVAALAGQDGVELSWSPSPEPDLVSYRVYRATGNAAPQVLAEVKAPTTSYQDVVARGGARYKYSLTAVDKAGNESARSVAVEAGR